MFFTIALGLVLFADVRLSIFFFLSTHQVNALIMGAVGYRATDCMRAGGIMTLLFWAVNLIMLNLIY